MTETAGTQESTRTASDGSPSSVLFVDASHPIGPLRNLQGASGMPGPAADAEHVPDISETWRAARVSLVRSYDWVSRLDTDDDPRSLFPDWSADPDDPASYNFAATDAWVRQVREMGADVLFTIWSSVPTHKSPSRDLAKYEQVVEHIVRHYVRGWGGGDFIDAVTWWEFGDQPDFARLHFDGSPSEFYEMFAAVARAVKRVDPALRFGGPCLAFPLNGGDFREGLLDYISQNDVPLDFFSSMWFTDSSRDPLDFRAIAAELRRVLDERGFQDAMLFLSYWNMTGIPTAVFGDGEAAAFQAASAIYMQDSVIDRAIFFRADTGIDLHYDIVDPAGIFEEDGGENARTRGWTLLGRILASGERLAVDGGDDNGFAVLAARTESPLSVSVLIVNYAIPDEFLVARERDVLEFQVPVGPSRETLSFNVLPRRTHAQSAGATEYSLDVANLPWGSGPHRVVRRRADAAGDGLVHDASTGEGSTASVRGFIGAPSVELVEITPIDA